MLHFTSVQAQKVLWAYNCRHELYDEDIMTLRDLKRIRLDTDIQMLCLPKYINKLVTVQEENDDGKFVKVKKWKKELQEYIVVFY